MCLSKVGCLPVYCYFRELAYKNMAQCVGPSYKAGFIHHIQYYALVLNMYAIFAAGLLTTFINHPFHHSPFKTIPNNQRRPFGGLLTPGWIHLVYHLPQPCLFEKERSSIDTFHSLN